MSKTLYMVVETLEITRRRVRSVVTPLPPHPLNMSFRIMTLASRTLPKYSL